ncbi:hypothetical protein D3C72_2363450 [compost metagenome]
MCGELRVSNFFGGARYDCALRVSNMRKLGKAWSLARKNFSSTVLPSMLPCMWN